MKKKDKLDYLIANHIEEYKEAYADAQEECDNETSMVCYCGKLATGLHTSGCSKYNNKINTKIINKLKHLLPHEEVKLLCF